MSECRWCGRNRDLNENGICKACEPDYNKYMQEQENSLSPEFKQRLKQLQQNAMAYQDNNSRFVVSNLRTDNKKAAAEKLKAKKVVEKNIKKAEKVLEKTEKAYLVALEKRNNARESLKQLKVLLGGKRK